MKKKKIMKWVTLVALTVLVVGGLNFLLMGLFQFDLFAALFGGPEAAVSRIFYSLFGIAALTLIGTILWKAFMTNKPQTTQKSA